MKRDLSNLTDEQVLELARKEGNNVTKYSLSIFDNPEEFYVSIENVDYQEAFKLLRRAMEEDLEFYSGSLEDGDDLEYQKDYVIGVRKRLV